MELKSLAGTEDAHEYRPKSPTKGAAQQDRNLLDNNSSQTPQKTREYAHPRKADWGVQISTLVGL